MKNLLKENTRARSMVRTLADCVRLVLGPCRPRGFQRKMPQHSRELLLSMLPTTAVGAEIGVHEGDFSRRILDVLKPRKMRLVDPWQYQTGEEHSQKRIMGAGRTAAKLNWIAGIFVFCSDSSLRSKMGRLRYIVAFRTRWPFQFPGEYFDFVYIDSDHRYATVKEDLEPYFKKLKVGGLLCGDDYGERG
jgi:hypothetical protein